MTRKYTSAGGIIARAARAHEDPVAMTEQAMWGRIAKHVAAALKANPDLTAEQAAKAGRLTLRAEMTRLGQASAKARAERAAIRAADLAQDDRERSA